MIPWVFFILQHYDRTGRELCIIVTNLSCMSEYYCHVKTTPNMEIGVAVRMSVSFPGNCSRNQWSTTSIEKIAKSAVIR